MQSVANSGALVQGASPTPMKTIRARVIRGVYARIAPGEPVRPHAEGTILELSEQDYAQLRMSNYVERAPAEVPALLAKRASE